MIRRLSIGSFVGAQDTSTSLILPLDPYIPIAVIYRGLYSRGDLLDLVCRPFSVVFNLEVGQDFTPLFMGKGAIVLLMFIQIILHGCGETVLNFNKNFTDRELLGTGFPIICLISLALHRKWREVLFRVMHLLNELGVAEDPDT